MLRARDNPFATDRVLLERYRLDEAGWAELLKKWERLGRRGALVGPHGSGKTTLLEDLAGRLERDGWRVVWVRLSAEFPRLPERCDAVFFAGLGTKDVVLVDGAEQLGAVAWWRFRWRVRKAGGLVITTHGAGRLGTLRRCETTAALLGELVAALGERIGEEEAERLHARHGGNVREALRELYDMRAQ
jgi:energy-coupling factor transporter ATP-binding protein EcfA2